MNTPAVALTRALPGLVPSQKITGSVALLREAVQKYGRVIYSSSLGVESIVLTDLIWGQVPGID